MVVGHKLHNKPYDIPSEDNQVIGTVTLPLDTVHASEYFSYHDSVALGKFKEYDVLQVATAVGDAQLGTFNDLLPLTIQAMHIGVLRGINWDYEQFMYTLRPTLSLFNNQKENRASRHGLEYQLRFHEEGLSVQGSRRREVDIELLPTHLDEVIAKKLVHQDYNLLSEVGIHVKNTKRIRLENREAFYTD